MNLVLAEWPDWWDWDLEITAHCLNRMQDRRFTEVDLRAMMEDATGLYEQIHGTFVVETQHDGAPWEVVVCPDSRKQRIVVVTAYSL